MQPAREPIHIRDVDVVRRNGMDRLRATVDNTEVWYDWAPDLAILPRLEPFLGAALLLGMADGRAIVADTSAAASPKLLVALESLQRLVRLWNPEAHAVTVDVPAAAPEQRTDMVASTYSGGVDSSCTLVRHKNEITHLLYMNGFDRQSTDSWADVSSEMAARIGDLGKQVVLVDSNVHEFVVSRGITVLYAHGSVLCGVLGTLAPGRAYIPGSFTYRDLKPWGSHPLLDPLWSTEATEIVHDSIDLTRTGKTEVISTDPDVLSRLQVCWRARNENCGKCSKCVRTMLALRLLGMERAPFPDVDVMSSLGVLKPSGASSAAFCWDLMTLAAQRGDHATVNKLRKMLRNYKVDRDVRSLVKTIVGRATINRINRWRGMDWTHLKLPLRDPDDFD